jgi:hypothetical protein
MYAGIPIMTMSDMTSVFLPDVDDVRKRIAKIPEKDMRLCLTACYLCAARVSEIVGKKSPSDVKTTARGPCGRDVTVDRYGMGTAFQQDAAVFRVKTAKRGGFPRLVALPLDAKFEPWTKSLVDYYKSHDYNESVFPFTRQLVGLKARSAFKGLRYYVYQYVITNKALGIKKEVPWHFRRFNVHALRHLRTTELIQTYGFNAMELSVYGGWTMRGMLGVGSAMERYVHLDWQQYFPKLLRERVA